MKEFGIAMFLVCFLVSNALAKDTEIIDSAITETLAVMAAIDLAQSVNMFDRGSQELNPLLSEAPSIGEMAFFGLVSVGGVYLVDRHMGPSRFKTVLLDSIIESEKANIEANQNVLRYGKRTVPDTIMLIVCVRL
jgi:hypothetical protein